jgi:hypothetical protein
MILHTSLALRQARLQAVLDALSVGGSPSLCLYEGGMPSTPSASPSGALLASLPWSGSAGTVGVDGADALLTLTLPDLALAVAGGTIGFARLVNGAGVGVIDADVSITPGAAVLLLDTLTVYAGGQVTLLAATLRE